MNIEQLLTTIRECQYCQNNLPLAAKPVVRATSNVALLVVGQAPGIRVHNTGIPWDDPSGNRLRKWLNMDKNEFYDDNRIAIVPMGFCYPGKGKSGDMPPRPECALLWRDKLHELLPNIKLTLLIGKYAQAYYLKGRIKKTLAETIQAYEEYLPLGFLPIIHPSPRNQTRHKKNQWFENDVIPILQILVEKVLPSTIKLSN